MIWAVMRETLFGLQVVIQCKFIENLGLQKSQSLLTIRLETSPILLIP